MYKNKENSFHSIFNIATLNPENISKNINEINYVDLSSVSLGNINNVQKIKKEEGFPSRAKRKTEIADILYSTVRPNLKGHAIVKDENLTVSTGFAVLRPNLKDDSSFIFYNLLYNHEKIIKMCKGGNYPAISGKDLAEVLVLDVDSNERKNISKILDEQQGLIDSYKEKLSLLEEQEAYYQDELLSGRLRIRLTDESINYATQQGWYLNDDLVEGKEKEFEEWIAVDFHCKVQFYKEENIKNWKLKKYETLIEMLKNQKKFNIQKKNIKEKGEFPVITQEQSFISGYTDDFDKVIDTSKQKYIVFGDHTTIFKMVNFDFVTGADGVKVYSSINEKEILTEYLYRISNNNLIKSTGYNRHFKILKDKNVLYPNKKIEQYNILLFLNLLKNQKDLIKEKIKVEEEKMDYLMDELLSGRIRVK